MPGEVSVAEAVAEAAPAPRSAARLPWLGVEHNTVSSEVLLIVEFDKND